MQEFAWVLNGIVQRFQHFEGAPELSPEKGAWLPVNREPFPVYDSRTQFIVEQVRTDSEFVHVDATVASLPIEQARAALQEDRKRIYNKKLDEGFPLSRLVPTEDRAIPLQSDTRGDISGMTTAALAVVLGVMTWPESYARGWITVDGSRFVLPTPQDGVALAQKYAEYYSDLAQSDQDLEDSINAVQEGDPWPTVEE